MELLGLLAIPLAIGSVAFLVARETITRGEFFVQLALSVALILAAWGLARSKSLEDVEHLNGFVTAKRTGSQACCHCHTECQERYFFGLCKREIDRCKHENDWFWSLEVKGAGELGESCLRRARVPSWWVKIQEGDPASIEHRYVNYLRADPASLMHRGFAGRVPEGAAIPPFPTIHEGVFVDRVVEIGVDAPAHWQAELARLNARLGSSKQVDITVVLGHSASPELALAVDAAWLSGPKNGVIVVIGAPDQQRVSWARVVSVSRNPALEIALRERLRGLTLGDPKLISILGEEVEAKFERTPMDDFRYLAGAAMPRGWWLVGLYVVAVLLSLGLSCLFHRVDFSRTGRRLALRNHAGKGMWFALAALLVRWLRRRSRVH